MILKRVITYVGSTWHTTMEIGGMVEKSQEIQYPLVSIHHVQLKVDTMPLYKPNFLISNEMWVIWLSQGHGRAFAFRRAYI